MLTSPAQINGGYIKYHLWEAPSEQACQRPILYPNLLHLKRANNPSGTGEGRDYL